MKLIPILIDTYLAAAIANLGFGIVDTSELTRSNALNGLVGMDVVSFLV